MAEPRTVPEGAAEEQALADTREVPTTTATGTGGTDAPAAAEGEELIRLTGLQVHFPIRGGAIDQITRRVRGVVRAVDGIDLSLRRGEVLALVGEYLGRIQRDVEGWPLYTIDEELE